jgi:hypothetical protein
MGGVRMMNYNEYCKILDFKKEDYASEIDKIKSTKVKVKKEPYYQKIAKDILSINHEFQNVIDGAGCHKIKGVPYDILGNVDRQVAIVELKGVQRGFNFPSDVQLARMRNLIKRFKDKYNIDLVPYLIQINLDYGIYCLWDRDFLSHYFHQISEDTGKSTPIEPAVDKTYELIINNSLR